MHGNEKIKSLKEYSNAELIEILDRNEHFDMVRFGPICAEILRRMNLNTPILPTGIPDLHPTLMSWGG